MHRSGTSALSRAMNLCGWQLANRIMPPSPGNPAGYWEPIEIVRFNDRLLKAIGRHWADPRPLPEGWASRPEIRALADEAADILSAEFQGLDGILIKDPRFSRLLPFWTPFFEAGASPPACLLMCRHPLEVARSLAARERMELGHGLLLWLAYMLDAEYWSRGTARATVDYASLIADWRAGLEPALDTIWPAARSALEARAAELDAFLDGTHRHFSEDSDDFGEAGSAAGLVARAFGWFRRPEADRAEIEAIRAQWRDHWDRREAHDECAAMMAALPRRRFEIANELKAQGALDAALAEIDLAIARAPRTTNYHARRGEILAALERFDEAVAAFERAMELGGFNANQLRNLCEAYVRCGRGERAISAMREAQVKADNIPWLAAKTGRKLGEIGHPREGEAMYAIALESRPENGLYHEGHSLLLEQLGRRREAIAAMERAIACGSRPRFRKRLEELRAAEERES